jgi:hypothetical protein
VEVPVELRPQIADVLRRVVEGDQDALKREGIYPHSDADLFEFVRSYGATLVPQPSETWTHGYSEVMEFRQDKWGID